MSFPLSVNMTQIIKMKKLASGKVLENATELLPLVLSFVVQFL